ncbi:uncharacterized protein METZ01_LOCUS178355, partial [marine metagenome]
ELQPEFIKIHRVVAKQVFYKYYY